MTVLEPGQRLGPYRIDGLLGRGGMAEVYRATHLTLERGVAIKVLDPAFNADPTFPLRFQREAKTVAQLKHPNIVTVYDFGELDRLAFLVMELASGGTLRQRARQFHSLAEVVEGLAPICAALQYAHDAGVIHRDVKPTNVLVDARGEELLADFGLARIASESLDFNTGAHAFGSPHYMAPERIEGEQVDQRVDIYALGALAYELIVGRLPYSGRTAVDVLKQHLLSPPPSIRSALPNAPPALDLAIRHAMAKQPQERIPSAAGFLEALRQAAAEAPELEVGASRIAHRTSTIPRVLPSAPPVPPATAPADASELTLPLDPAAFVPSGGGSGGLLATAPDPERAVLLAAEAPASAPASWERQRGKSRRATSLNEAQWLALGTSLLIVVFINAVGLWLALEGRAAAGDNLASGVTTYISDHLGAFKSSLATLALLLAILAVVSMRLALAKGGGISTDLYRRLRQYHRFVGYLVVVIVFAVGLLTCAGIFGFGTATPRDALHSALGAALLVLLLVKIAVVRYFPAQRRHLRLLGEGILVLLFLVFATSTIPFLWSHLAGTSKSNPYNPYVGRSSDTEPSVPASMRRAAASPRAPSLWSSR